MNLLLLLLIVFSLAALPPAVLAQDPVPIRFQVDPVLVQSSTEIVFTVLTTSQVLSITWGYPGGETPLGLWAAGNAVVNPVPQYQGRVTITATQLRIASAQLRDAGNYTVEVNPLVATGLSSNSRSIQLRVFDAVAGVSLAVPSVALEGGNVSLSCTWTAGTETSVQWGKGGSALPSDSRITISQGSLLINPARRGDAGDYTCTVSNPVSARTATQSLTVYYGPDTPQLTTSTPAECVGGADAVVGQTVRLTCVSDSLPPSTFSWQHDGQPVASGQPGSGVLSVQTFSTNESGRYTCVASNAITRNTSEQGTDLAVVVTCLSGGAVAGIVIGCVVALILIIIAIILLLRWRNVDRRLRDSMRLPKPEHQPRRIEPDPPLPQANRVDRGQHPNPPLHYVNTNLHNNYTLPLGGLRNAQTLPQNGPLNASALQPSGQLHSNGLPHNAHQNSYPHDDATHNHSAFTHAHPQSANTLPNSQQPNPNILIQAGNAQAGTQAPTIHVNLNTLPQQSNNAQLPTVHVNLNSYPANGQPSRPTQDPHDDTTQSVHVANSQSAIQHHNNRQNATQAGPPNPRMQSELSYRGNSPQAGRSHGNASPQALFGLIPTGYTHSASHTPTEWRNADTQTYQRDPLPDAQRRADPADAGSPRSDSRLRQMPWDRMRGTPAYPRGGPFLPASDGSDYTSQPPTRQPRNHRPGAHTPTTTTPPRGESASRQSRTLPPSSPSSQGAGLREQNSRSVTQPEAAGRTPIGYTERQSAQRDIRAASHQSQAAPRQAASHSRNPQALPPSSQQQSANRAAAPQEAPPPQERTPPPQGPPRDSRARADPNHLPQMQTAVRHGAGQMPTVPQDAQGQRVTAIKETASNDPSSLTQAMLQTHTRTTHNPFHDRNQQTRAALLSAGPQARAANPGVQRPPTPPAVIPLAQFHTMPRERTQNSSPNRATHRPPRPPVNVPMAARHGNTQAHRHAAAATMHANPHRHPGNAHTHANAHRPAHAHGHQGRPSQPHQGHRGRPAR